MLKLKTKIKKIIKICISYFLYVLTIVNFHTKHKSKDVQKSLLIIKLDAIGDYVLFRNFLKEIKTSSLYSDYKITLIGNINFKDLAENLDKNYVDEFIWINKKRIYKNIFNILKIKNKIYNKFNITIHATYSREFMGDLFVKLSGAKIRIGFKGDANNISPQEKKVTDHWYTELIDIDTNIHFEFYKNRDLFSKFLHKELTIKKPYINLEGVKEPDLPKFDNFVLLFPGAQQVFRRWSPQKFKEIAEYIINTYDLDVVVCGSETDKIAAHIISKDNKRVHDLTGKTSLIQLTFIISKARLVISNDTSGSHIAGALNVPTIILFQLNHYLRFAPYPKEISEKMYFIMPKIFYDIPQIDLVEKFKYGSDIDVSLVLVEDVKKIIEKINFI